MRKVTPIDYDEFLTRIIDEGIAAAKCDYANSPDKLKGSVEGFEACREKKPTELRRLLAEACNRSHAALHRAQKTNEAKNYWEICCYELEIEWVCNCVSAMLMNEGFETIVTPTARGVMQAAKIIGVRS